MRLLILKIRFRPEVSYQIMRRAIVTGHTPERIEMQKLKSWHGAGIFRGIGGEEDLEPSGRVEAEIREI